jgi:CspA family cold shock protein
MATGTVCAIKADKGFGFIALVGAPDLFFHFSDLDKSLAFDESLRERRVEFDITESSRGPRAANVRPAV